MDNWEITYIDTEGLENTIEVPAVNKIMAYAVFTDIIMGMYGTTEGIEVIFTKRVLN